MPYQKKYYGLTFLICLLLVGCVTLNSSIVTVTEVVDSAMKQWSQLAVTGKTTPEFNAKVEKAHEQYRKAAAVAQLSLIAYKNTSAPQDLVAALTAAKNGALPLIDLIGTILDPDMQVALNNQLAKAVKP